MLWRRQLRCSFCQKRETEIQKLVAGPGVYICDECVSAAKIIIDDASDGHEHRQRAQGPLWLSLLHRVQRLAGGRIKKLSDVEMAQ